MKHPQSPKLQDPLTCSEQTITVTRFKRSGHGDDLLLNITHKTALTTKKKQKNNKTDLK